jgi:ADP-ribose pyrophosphatase YjhB (NUDIX family)
MVSSSYVEGIAKMGGSTLYIGASGHQQIGDEATIGFVSEQLRVLLTTFQRQACEHGQDIIARSALAIGTDRLFVKTALALDIPVEVIKPCAGYADIYDSSEIRKEYYYLLGRCKKVYELPIQECSEDAYYAAGHWVVDHSDLVILVWNGYPAGGKGGTADVATYARLVGRPFIHIHTVRHVVKQYGSLYNGERSPHESVKRDFVVEKETVFQGPVIEVNHYRLQMPGGKVIERDIVERPESVLVLPVGQANNVMLIEEYDLGAGVWQLTLPDGKVIDSSLEGIVKQAQVELREETGFRAGKFEKLLDLYSHPGYIAHKVHLLVAYDLEWDPLEMDDGEEVRVHTFTLDDALAATKEDYRCDPEAALALWLYAEKKL